jgi:ketosteroid isomerase-like protein
LRSNGYAQPVMAETTDPLLEALSRYSAAVYDKDVSAFVALYADDLHVFDMWNSWELRGLVAWREMAAGWFASLGDERVVVKAHDVASEVRGDFALGHATLTFTGFSAQGQELRSLDNRLTLALRREGGGWKVFHQHTSGPIAHDTLKATLKRVSP